MECFLLKWDVQHLNNDISAQTKWLIAQNYNKLLPLSGEWLKALNSVFQGQRVDRLDRDFFPPLYVLGDFKIKNRKGAMQRRLNIPWLLRWCDWQGLSVCLHLILTLIPSAVSRVGATSVISPSSLTWVTPENVWCAWGDPHSSCCQSMQNKASRIFSGD